MPAIPIPLATALLLAYLGVKAALEGETPKMVLGLIALCAGQSLIISLNQYYGLTVLGRIQPVTAVAIPVMAYLTFLSTSIRRLRLIPDIVHLALPVIVAFASLVRSEWLDPALIAGFLGYALLILFQLRSGGDSLPLMRLENNDRALVLWRWTALALIGSIVSDLAITAASMLGAVWLRPWIVSVYSSLFLLALGVLNLSDAIKPPPTDEDRSSGAAPASASGPTGLGDDEAALSHDLIGRLTALMQEAELYLDPDLTLGRLARRLGVSEKQLSSAVNRVTGDNVSRFINTYRIDHACRLLAAGETVTAVIFASGFNTKSNFNREFLRLKGTPPSLWQKGHTD